MYYQNLGNPSRYTPSGADTGCLVSPSDTCLDNTGPFTLHSSFYWFGKEYQPNTQQAWFFLMDRGEQASHTKEYSFYAWAVHPGDIGAVPEPETYALFVAGLVVIGAALRRRGRFGVSDA